MEGSFAGVSFPLLIEIRNDVSGGDVGGGIMAFATDNGMLSQQIELLLGEQAVGGTTQLEYDEEEDDDDSKFDVMQFLKYKKKPESDTLVNPEKSPFNAQYSCAECSETFENKGIFDIHMSGHANNMKCAICNMVLKSFKNYEKHCLRCKPYECQICGRVVRFRPNFIKHMRVHTGQQSERHKYKCEVCHKEFMSFEYFKVHKKIHNENVNLTCEVCGKVFSALASLRGHSKLHTGIKLHKCDVCGKGFGQRYNLKIHSRVHTGEMPFECTTCGKKLHTQSSYQTHLQTHHTTSDTITEEKEQSINAQPFQEKIEPEIVKGPMKSVTKRESETQTDFIIKSDKIDPISTLPNEIISNVQSDDPICVKYQELEKLSSPSKLCDDHIDDTRSENSSITSSFHHHARHEFENELIESNDLSNSITYSNLFESSSIPESIPEEMYLEGENNDNDDNFQLNRNIDLQSTTTDGNFIRKEWVYSNYSVGQKFDEDDYCETASFIYD